MPSFLRRIIKNPGMLGLTLLLPGLPGHGEVGAQQGSRSQAAPADPPEVVCSYYPLYIFALNVMEGTRGPAPTLLLEPTGGCAHGIALRPAQVAHLRRATAIVETGLGLEPFLDDSRFHPAGEFVRISAARGIGSRHLIALEGEHGDHPHHGHDHDDHGESAGFNGHAWTSPRLAARMVRTLGRALGEIDPAQAARYAGNAAAFAGRLEALHLEFEAVGAELRGRRVALSHTSLAYLAKDLCLEVAATLRDEDEHDPGPRAMARMIGELRASGIDAILYDPQDSGRLAQLLARETGCERLILLDPVAAGPLEAGAYEKIQQENLKRLQAWADSAHAPLAEVSTLIPEDAVPR